MRCTIFAGPSTHGLKGLHAGQALDLRPPVQRNDLRALMAAHRPHAVAIVDGLFHDALAVGHWEIRDLLLRGWPVWGLSSMGAVRASEMEHLGMRGFGHVFEHYRAHPRTPDDEVALLHGPAPDYVPVSEPLLHLRAALRSLGREGFISADTHDRIVTELEAQWFGDRRVAWVVRRIATLESEDAAARARERLGDFSAFRLKTHDLARFLEVRPWQH